MRRRALALVGQLNARAASGAALEQQCSSSCAHLASTATTEPLQPSEQHRQQDAGSTPWHLPLLPHEQRCPWSRPPRLRSSCSPFAPGMSARHLHTAALSHAAHRAATHGQAALPAGALAGDGGGLSEALLVSDVTAPTAAAEALLSAALSVPEAAAGGGSGGGGTYRLSWLPAMQAAAAGVQWVHDASGLPWWASIPLTTLGVRLALLPFSMWQARTVRSTYMVYKEAKGLTDKQLGEASPPSPQSQGGGAPESEADARQRARRTRVLLSNFALLRGKLGAPHPAWVLVNPLVQLPVFMALGGGLRLMAARSWPGLSTGGALWFPDLTQVALVPGSLWWALPPGVDPTPWVMPLGPLGAVLPLALLGMMLTSLRIGFGAAGQAPADDAFGRFMRALPYVLYTLAVVNAGVAMQLPHAALLHWLASSSFTLGLQLSLQQPAFRAAFNLPSPAELQAALTRAVNQRLLQLSEQGGALGPGRGYAVSSLPDALLKQVAGERSADVLVILGAQNSAQKRYREALYCLDRALQLDPAHVRAHYSRGQVFSLNNRWPDAEACFRRAAELASSPPEKGQALYCVATAVHTQGRPDAAVPLYREAAELWPQPVIAFSLSNALIQLGRLQEAKDAITAALAAPGVGPFLKPLQQLADQVDAQLARKGGEGKT